MSLAMLRLIRVSCCGFAPLWLIVGLLACGGPDRSTEGAAKPSPSPRPTAAASVPSPARRAAATQPTTDSVVSTPTAATTPAVTPDPPSSPSVSTEPANVPPEVQEVFDRLDTRFANSKARDVSIVARIEMLSGTRGYRGRFRYDMKLQFPNRMNLRALEVTEINDPETTTAWQHSKLPWLIISDGEKMYMKKAFAVTQSAPATFDGLPERQIELPGWGDNALINCFLRTRPSEAFKSRLKRARLVERTPERIDLELVTAPTGLIQESRGIPASFDVVHRLSISMPQMIPSRCYIEMKDLSREILRKVEEREVPVESAFVEIVVQSVDLGADFSGEDVFEISEELLKNMRPANARSSQPSPLRLREP